MATQQTATPVYAQRPWIRHYDPGVPASIEDPGATLTGFLSAHAARFPGRPAISFYDRAVTYAELAMASARFASALAGLGVRKGDRVALLLPNTPQFVIGYYGALQAGAIVVPSNPLYAESELEHQLRDSGATVILTLSKFLPSVQAVRGRTQLRHVVVTNIKEYFPRRMRILFTVAKERKDGHHVRFRAADTHWLQQLMAASSGAPPQIDLSPDDVALLQYTGGTTGTAKGAVLTHRNLVTDLLMVRAWLGQPPATRGYDVIMGVLPLFHSYGMAGVMNTAIVGGGTMVLVPRFEHVPVLKAIQRHRPNLFPGVPTMYIALNTFPGVAKFDLRSIDACISGAAALPMEVKRRFEELTGARLVEGFGLTEASPVTHANPIHGLSKPGAIGIPMPGTDAKIVDVETGSEVVPVGGIGELVVRGPQVMQGYWNSPLETADVLRDGWLYTGDIARMDEDGYFYIVDRKKDMIISGGFNVYPGEVEAVLYAHPKVKEAVALGIPDRRWGEMVKVYVVLNEGATATEEEIVEFCRGRLARYKVPKVVEFRPELPKTMIGKVLRRVLRDAETGGARIRD